MKRLQQSVFLLDEAFHLLRMTSARAWAIYLLGALPLLLGVMYFVPDFINPNAPVRLGSMASFLAPLYLWFGVCRFAYARELLTAAGDDVPAHDVRALCNQLFLHAAELVLLPLSALAILPFAWMLAFFRHAACHPEPALGELIKESARRSSAEQGQNWFVVVLTAPLAIALFLNVAITFLVLPNLLKVITGYETGFTRYHGWIESPMTWLAVLGTTVFLVEALLLSAFALRVFYQHSETSGRDLVQSLKRLATGSLVVCSFACVPSLRAADPGASGLNAVDLERHIRQVMHQQKYDWVKHLEDRQERNAPSGFWKRIDDAYVSIRNAIRNGWQAILDFIKRWMPRSSNPDNLQSGKPPGHSLGSLVWVLAAVAIGVTGLIVAKAIHKRDAPIPPIAVGVKPTVDLIREQVLATELPDEEWLTLANRYTAEGNTRLAVRALYLATLAWLAQRELLSISVFKSNAEYEAELTRRSRSNSVIELFAKNRMHFERTWYGNYEAGLGLVDSFRSDFLRMKEETIA